LEYIIAPSTASASIDEFVFSMVVAGLAAKTPYMINATIASLSRLIFEFKGNKLLFKNYQALANLPCNCR